MNSEKFVIFPWVRSGKGGFWNRNIEIPVYPLRSNDVPVVCMCIKIGVVWPINLLYWQNGPAGGGIGRN